MQITKQGTTAAVALLGAVLTCLIALVGLEKLSPVREAALICLSSALPLLSFGVSVELLQYKPRLPGSYHLWLLLLGTGAGLVGIALTLAAISILSAIAFVALSLLTVGLSAHVTAAIERNH